MHKSSPWAFGSYPRTVHSLASQKHKPQIASNGNAVGTYGMVYSYFVPEGGYALNGNLMAHSDSVMGGWAFQYDALNWLTLLWRE
jgi:hypothetical protein